MKASSLRIFFVVVLLLSLGLRSHALTDRVVVDGEFDITGAITDLVREAGLKIRENRVHPPDVMSRFVYFVRPECSQPSVAIPFNINNEELPFLESKVLPGYRRRYVFLNRNWGSANRVGTFLVWLKYSALSTVGASPFLPARLAFVLADPPGCSFHESVDWSLVWDRTRFVKPAGIGSGTT